MLPKAKVTVTSLATGASSTATTSNEGVYLVVNLTPGEYLVQAEATGFQRYEQTVSLELGARSRLDLSLPVGSIGETVTVEGVTPLLSTESAVLGTVVDSNEIDRLPLSIRNWDDLLSMVPGVQSDRYTEQAGGTSAGRTGGVSVHGNRSLQNNFLLDGVANNSFSTNVQELTTQLSRPSVDAIDEFKVVTSPYAAEYGWSPGAAIIVNTKSGTNQIRGTVYDFYRDDRMDTINYFAKAANQPKATNKQNQFGGNVGGPLVRNRAFFFADYEGTRLEQGVLRTGNVMTADQRRGVFTSAVRDPLTGQPFPNNTIPTNRIDPVAASIMSMVPLPNTTGANNFIRQPNVEDESDRYMLRARPADSATATTCSSATSAAIASASCRDGSAACSTARRPRRGAGTSSTRTPWSAAGTRCSARVSSTNRASRTRAAPTTGSRIRSARAAWRRSASRACRTIRASPAASSASTSTATSASARRTSCRSSSTPARCSGSTPRRGCAAVTRSSSAST